MAATARLPTRPRGLSAGEYAAITARASSPTSTGPPPASAAATTPSSTPRNAHNSAVLRRSRPAASGRSPPGRFTRSALTSQRSLSAFPAAPNPTAAREAKTRTCVTVISPRAIQPPARTPAAATSRLWARMSRSMSSTQDVLVQPLVAGHDPIGGELERAARGGVLQAGVQRGVPQHANGMVDHAVHVANGREEARLPVHHDLGEAADGAGEDRHGTGHRLQGGEAERFGLGGQQKQVAAAQHVRDVVHLAEEANLVAQVEPIGLLLGGVAVEIGRA